MREEWKEDPLGGYRENARHLFGYPESTLAEYVRDLEHFQKWLVESAMGGDGSGGRNAALLLLGCGRGWIEDYLVELSNRGLRAVTINRKIYSLNSFFTWALHQGLVEVSPLNGVRKLKTPRRIPKFLTFEDIQKLLAHTGSVKRTSTIRGKQIHAMMAILYYLGLRREELVSIRYEHIEKVAEGEIYLHVFGKGDKQRLVPFPAPAFEAYQRYNLFRPECPSSFVFISLKTRMPLSKYDVNAVCRRIHKRLQLSKKLTPHLLRYVLS
jgi:site-specific recombinase XerD